MATLRRISVIDQTAAHLREGLAAGRWTGRLPGVRPLAVELGVGVNAVRAAVGLLVSEGLLAGKGAREARTIVAARPMPAKGRSLRIALLINGPLARKEGGIQTGILGIITGARDDGHDCFVVSTPAGKDTHKTGYLAKLVEANAADAWIVHEGSLEVLRWFESRGIPTLAAGGRSAELKLASATFNVEGALREAVRRLAALGHRRIVMISSEHSRRPEYSPLMLAFRDELEKAGVKPGEYHTPEWDESPAGLFTLLDSLFKVTPPTALICWPATSAFGTISRLAGRGLEVPEDVSVISLHDPSELEWLRPGMRVAHMDFDDAAWFRRIREWIRSVSAGRPDRKPFAQCATLSPGNTLGPAKAG